MTKARQTLDDLLGDPLIQLVMARDGWHQEEVRMLVERARPVADDPIVPPAHVIDQSCLRQWACRG